MQDLSFYHGKRVFITGHTGFKGAWLSLMLLEAGAEVTGYALEPNTQPNLYALLGLCKHMRSVIGDVRDFAAFQSAFAEARPEIALHLAAQPIVRESYRDPVGTYSTNVMGTVHFLEAARQCESVRSIINVTTDKVYQNNEWTWGYRENDALDGYDPYSNSKSCSELVTACFQRALFTGDLFQNKTISTCRAGNVIGGGDFAKDRIIPDCVRAALRGESIVVRNPYSTRPYQHVLDPLYTYLLIAQRQYADAKYAGSYNIGPDACDCVNTGALADLFCGAWGENLHWVNTAEKDAPHEANFLKLDCSKAKSVLGWQPRWHIDTAIEKTVEWSKALRAKENIAACMRAQLREFLHT